MKTHMKVLVVGIIFWVILSGIAIYKMQTTFDRSASKSDPAVLAYGINNAAFWGELAGIVLVVSIVSAIYMWKRSRKKYRGIINVRKIVGNYRETV